jgi:MFS transporter, DHA1 family, inner membrane transport protein
MLETQKVQNLFIELGILTSSRTVINTAVRMVYPLLPVFAREFKLELSDFALLLTLSQLLGLTAPVIGILPERFGRRFTILLGLIIFNLGMLAVFIFPNFLGFSLAFLLAAFGKITFDPTVQAYFGERVPYEKRGMVLGIIELAWSGAFFLGVPLMIWLIDISNWQIPFAALGFLGVLGFGFSSLILQSTSKEGEKPASFLKGLRLAASEKSAFGGIIFMFCICAANQLIGVVFASWIEDSFGIALSSLALASIMIGIAELGGESFVVFFADRLGKRRLMIVGILGNLLVCLFLPVMGVSLSLAIAGLFCFYLSFELGLVASIPLLSELSPKSRATYMTVIAAASTFGRAICTFIAPSLYENGLIVNCGLALLLNAISLLVLWYLIRLD